MANHKSAVKRIQVGQRNQAKNRYERTTMKTRVKQVLTSEKKEEGLQKYQEASSIIDKMVKKGVLHRNTAANKKARLMKHVNSLT